MIYADLNSFFELEVSSNYGKQLLLDTIELDIQKRISLKDDKGNVYKLIIKYNENKVEIKDWIVSPDETQEAYTTTLAIFIQALKEYTPRQ